MTTGPAIPPELLALMAEIGPRWASDVPGNVKLMAEGFSAVLKDAPRDGVAVERELAYGAHERQRFDIFAPAPRQGLCPAVVIIHGGAFTDGHRNRTDQIHANIGFYFARHGVFGINFGYRLAPEARHPDAALDVAAMVEWLGVHGPARGIDPGRIFLMGHSAGATHASSYAYDKRLQPADGPRIAGLMVISGRVRIDTLPENPNAKRVEAYYGGDASIHEAVSPVSHVTADSVPTFVAWSEFENPLLDVYCAELVHRLAAVRRRTPPMLYLAGHNHNSIVAHINTADDRLGAALLAFIDHPR